MGRDVLRIMASPALAPERLFTLPHAEDDAPTLYIDRSVITQKYGQFRQAFPGAELHYAMKCNPDSGVLRHLKALGGGFEIASYTELAELTRIGVSPADVLYSNPVKSQRHIRLAYDAGVRCFAFQSDDELRKLAALGVPGVNVYLRLATASGESTVASESKFGQQIDAPQGQATAVRLLRYAITLGLTPYGLAFHVGSQMQNPQAWTVPLVQAGLLLRALADEGIHLTMLDIGGGFPAYHAAHIPPLSAYGRAINRGMAALPYQPERLVLEPGRALVSDAGVMLAEVYGSTLRGGRHWLYLSVGAFNGFMEALETGTALRYPMADSRASAKKTNYIVSGPSCDSQDMVSASQWLSADLQPGDKVAIYTAGAYTTAYASNFNGFAVPRVEYVL